MGNRPMSVPMNAPCGQACPHYPIYARPPCGNPPSGNPPCGNPPCGNECPYYQSPPRPLPCYPPPNNFFQRQSAVTPNGIHCCFLPLAYVPGSSFGMKLDLLRMNHPTPQSETLNVPLGAFSVITAWSATPKV